MSAESTLPLQRNVGSPHSNCFGEQVSGQQRDKHDLGIDARNDKVGFLVFLSCGVKPVSKWFG